VGRLSIAQTELTFNPSTPQGKPITNLMASLAEFDHDLLRERGRSGIADAKPGDKTFGRTPGYRLSYKHTGDVIRLIQDDNLS
jgi:putative DNA-invertase from lambdoid prophage Rac